MGVKPEQLELEIGRQQYRFVKFFNIAPEKPLPADRWILTAKSSARIIVQGYKDATHVIREFLAYEVERPPRDSRRVVHLSAERLEGNFHTARQR